MKKILFTLLLLPFLTFSQNSYNMGLIGTYEWNSSEGNDIWGWVSPTSEDEYALIGLNDGFACVNVSSPSNPTLEFQIADINSTWRDVKTWGNYAYVTTEADAGLLIVDLTDMTGNTNWHVSNFTNPTTGASVEFTAAHNLYIDENGICYIFGASSATGSSPSDGAIFLDVAANATAPHYLGEWNEHYIHDGMVRGDTMYAGCIYAGELYVVDVSDKNNPSTLGTHSTPNNFTHNAWISDDGDYVFTTDETSDAYLAAYDITDCNNIQEVDRIQSNPGSSSIPHNTHVDGNFLITSYYRDGTTVHDISQPNNMVQVAYYDSYSGSGNGFDGCWGTYPYLPSGIIISSDINSSTNGNAKLLVFERGFSGACYLEGNVTDGSTGAAIIGANIVILNTIIPNSSTTNLSGNYSCGNADGGIFDVVFSMPGYINDTLQATLINGQIVILNVVLNIDPNVPILGCMDASANNYNPNANTALEYGGEADNTFSSGGFFNGNQHLIFNASSELLIKSAQFYADNPTTVTFELRSSNGAVIDDTTHSLSQGQQQLILNFEVPIGNNMQLGISNGNSDLYRNDAGAIYPYNIGSVMSITGTSAGSPGYYYFYYDIEVEVPCDNTVSSIDDIKELSKELVKILDVLGREVVPNPNQTQFYIYDDGSVHKQINIE
ncbi:choice-of-anchor B family protein [Flavobacteriales bacterium]|nr:choice-of-anchor B family protein [Flavobacteriales bacterium]